VAPTADESILVAGVDLVLAETEASYKPVVLLSLKGSWRVKYMIRGVVNDIHLVVSVLEELILLWSIDGDSLCQFLFFEVPDYKKR
jgi:hypothetical protein